MMMAHLILEIFMTVRLFNDGWTGWFMVLRIVRKTNLFCVGEFASWRWRGTARGRPRSRWPPRVSLATASSRGSTHWRPTGCKPRWARCSGSPRGCWTPRPARLQLAVWEDGRLVFAEGENWDSAGEVGVVED